MCKAVCLVFDHHTSLNVVCWFRLDGWLLLTRTYISKYSYQSQTLTLNVYYLFTTIYRSLSFSFSLTSFRRFAVWKPTTITTLQRTPSKRFCKDHTPTIMQQLKQPLKHTPELNNVFFHYWLSRAISCGPTMKEL